MLRQFQFPLLILAVVACHSRDQAVPLVQDAHKSEILVPLDSISIGIPNQSDRMSLNSIQVQSEGRFSALITRPVSLLRFQATDSVSSQQMIDTVGLLPDIIVGSLINDDGSDALLFTYPSSDIYALTDDGQSETRVYDTQSVTKVHDGRGNNRPAVFLDGELWRFSISTDNGIHIYSQADSSRVLATGIVASRFRQSPRTTNLFALIQVAATRDKIVFVSSASDLLFTVNADGHVDSMPVPRTARAGAPEDLGRAIIIADSLRVFGPFSSPAAIGVLADESYAVIYDEEAPSKGSGRMAWLNIIDSTGSPLCTDIDIPGIGHPTRKFSFNGDTLLVAQLTGNIGSRELSITRFSINPSQC